MSLVSDSGTNGMVNKFAGMVSFHECLGGLPHLNREERISLGGVRRGEVFIGFDRLPFPTAATVCECNIRVVESCPRVMMG